MRASNNGRLVPPSVLSSDLTSRINPADITWRPIDPSTGFVYGIIDAKGRIVLGITTEGYLRARLSNGAMVPAAALDPSAIARLTPDGVSWKSMPRDSGYIFAALDAKGRILFGVTPEGRFKAKLAPGVAVTTEELQPLVATAVTNLNLTSSPKRITCAGDSMTAGAGGSGTTYPGVLATLFPGATFYNLGIGGQTSTQISARLGGVPIKVTVTGDSIPASGGVAVTAKSVNILYNSGSFSGTATGTLAGIPGTMSTDTSGSWTFTRTTAGSAVACPANTVFLPDVAADHENDTMIIWAGRNNSGSPAVVLSDILAMIDRLKPLNKRVLVLSVCNGLNEGTGTGAYNNIAAVNKELARHFGDQFIDVRRYLIDFGLAEAGITPTSQDTTDVAADTVPASLRYDSVHLIAAGYTVIANLIARVLRAKGWI